MPLKPDAAGPEGEQLLYDADKITYMAPIPVPSKIFSIAINNRQKYEIADLPDGPKHPYYFIKVPTCVVGPYDTLEIPKETAMSALNLKWRLSLLKKGVSLMKKRLKVMFTVILYIMILLLTGSAITENGLFPNVLLKKAATND